MKKEKMEKQYFWALLIIALVAGAAITMSVGSMTGNALSPWVSRIGVIAKLPDCSNCQNTLEMLGKCDVYDAYAADASSDCNWFCGTKGETCVFGLGNVMEKTGNETFWGTNLLDCESSLWEYEQLDLLAQCMCCTP